MKTFDTPLKVAASLQASAHGHPAAPSRLRKGTPGLLLLLLEGTANSVLRLGGDGRCVTQITTHAMQQGHGGGSVAQRAHSATRALGDRGLRRWLPRLRFYISTWMESYTRPTFDSDHLDLSWWTAETMNSSSMRTSW